MIKVVTIATDSIDSQCDRFLLSGVKMPDKKALVVTENFDNSNPLGIVNRIWQDGNELKAELDLMKNADTKGCYPAMGFQILDSEVIDGVRVIKEVILHYVGICGASNVDSNIKPLN